MLSTLSGAVTHPLNHTEVSFVRLCFWGDDPMIRHKSICKRRDAGSIFWLGFSQCFEISSFLSTWLFGSTGRTGTFKRYTNVYANNMKWYLNIKHYPTLSNHTSSTSQNSYLLCVSETLRPVSRPRPNEAGLCDHRLPFAGVTVVPNEPRGPRGWFLVAIRGNVISFKNCGIMVVTGSCTDQVSCCIDAYYWLGTVCNNASSKSQNMDTSMMTRHETLVLNICI